MNVCLRVYVVCVCVCDMDYEGIIIERGQICQPRSSMTLNRGIKTVEIPVKQVHTYIQFRLSDFRRGAEQAWKKNQHKLR